MSFSTLFFYVRYAVSYRDLEEIMEEGALMWIIPHSIIGLSTIHPPCLALEAKKIKRVVATSWRMDESYIKGKGEC
jgi:putative transposase